MTSDVRYRLKPGTIIETLLDGVLLFSESSQEIHRLNDSGAALMSHLTDGATSAQLEAALESAGVDCGRASAWTASMLQDVARLRLLEAELPPRQSPPVTQQISLAGLKIELRYASRQLFCLLAAGYRHLESPGAVDLAYEIVDGDKFVLIAKSGQAADVVERELAGVWLKGAILEAVLEQAPYVAALHSACLVGTEGAVLLLGSPGSGKTILTMALMQHGYRYGSDDVTLVTSGGDVFGLALAPGIKESAWEIAGRLGQDLSQAPVHLRPDGQKVRFAPFTDALAGPGRVSMVLQLRRSTGCSPSLSPIGATAALAEILREARSPDGRCSAEVIRILSDIVRNARCFELHYADAQEAAQLISAGGNRLPDAD